MSASGDPPGTDERGESRGWVGPGGLCPVGGKGACPSRYQTALNAVLVVIALLVAKRLAYHLTYIVRDPFALATFSDGQLYEDAARDILAHPPFGSQPFYLQGAYAYLLALPMSLSDHVVMGLLVQLVLAAGALWLFHRAATAQLGALAGALSTLCLLAFSELAFYENKYLSVSFGVSCNILALFAACRALRGDKLHMAVIAGACAGLSVLGRPNMVFALPVTGLALFFARDSRRAGLRALSAFVLGAGLALAPMAMRNQIVIGRAEVFPSHAGAIPFYIGNNPHANGRWNDAGGLLSGQVGRERFELRERLGLHTDDNAELDHAIAQTLWKKSGEYIREHPVQWFLLELKKLWYTLGNHRFVRDYDVRGEAELIGAVHETGLPFGVLLGLGSLGLFALYFRAAHEASERRPTVALLIVLAGQLVAVLVANVLVFTSAQNRVPLAIPLAFASGPALLALAARIPRFASVGWGASSSAYALCGLLLVQAFWPRLQSTGRPSSVHYFNLAAVEEDIGRDQDAARDYGRAVQRNPREPMFPLRQAHVLRRLGRWAEASAALARIDAMPGVSAEIRALTAQERKSLALGPGAIAP